MERHLAEVLRTDRHPLIRFRQGAAGRREPLIVGTRLLVRQVMPTVREDGVETTAAELCVPVTAIAAAVAYYAEFADEVDADAAWALRVEQAEQERWQREQAVLA